MKLKVNVAVDQFFYYCGADAAAAETTKAAVVGVLAKAAFELLNWRLNVSLTVHKTGKSFDSSKHAGLGVLVSNGYARMLVTQIQHLSL